MLTEEKKLHILYLEDDEGLARLLMRKLERENFQVSLAFDGYEGLKKIKANTYNVILLDQILPGLSGLDILKEFNRSAISLPVIMVTGMGNESIAVEAMKLGAYDYIIKDAEGGYIKLLPAVIRKAWTHYSALQDKIKAEQALKKSEEYYRELVEQADDLIYTIDLNGFLTTMNQAVRNMLGYHPDELIGRPFGDFIVPECYSKVLENIQKAIQHSEYTAKYELKFIRKDGQIIIAEVKCQLRYCDGKPTEIFCIARDITERLISEEALRISEEKYRSLIENLGEGVGIVDKNERIGFMNPAGANIFGLPAEQLIGRSLLDFISESDHQKVIEQTRKRQEGSTDFYDIEIIRPNGEKRFINVTATPLFNREGVLTETLGIFFDITERKKAEEELMRKTLLLDSIRQAQNLYIVEQYPKPIYDELLQIAVNITGSEIGFLDEVLYDSEGDAYIINRSMTGIYDYEDNKGFYDEIRKNILDFEKSNNIRNEIKRLNDFFMYQATIRGPLSLETPRGQMYIHTFCVLPICIGEERVGLIGLANFQKGYQSSLTSFLEPYLNACGVIFHAVRIRNQEQMAVGALRESEEKFRKAFMISPDAICINRLSDGLFIAVNHSFTEMTGYKENEIIHFHLKDLKLWVDNYELRQFINKLRNEGFVHNFEASFQTKTGDIRFGLLSATIIDLKGASHVLSITRDITERKKTGLIIQRQRDLISELLSLHTMDDVLEKTLSFFMKLDEIDAGAYYLFSPGSNSLEVIESHNVTNDVVVKILEFVKAYPEYSIIQQGNILFAGCDQFSPEYWPLIQEEKIQLVIMVPVVRGNQVIGGICLASKKHSMLNSQTRNLIELTFRHMHTVVERIEVMEALVQGETRYRNLVETFPEAICVVQDQKIIFSNRHGIRLFGVKDFSELSSYELSALVSFDDKNSIRANPSGSSPHPVISGKIKRVSNGELDVEIISTETIYAGQPSELLIIRDVTEIRQLQEKARRNEHLAAIGQMAAIIAHEIRNPLGAVSLNFQYLTQEWKSEKKYSNILNNIEEGMRRIQTIITGILDFTRPLPMSITDFDITEIIESAFRAVEYEIGKKNIQICRQYHVSNCILKIDPQQIYRVFINLFLNAVQAMTNGGELRVTLDENNDTCTVKVEDTGKGIEPSDIDKIFLPFFTKRVDGIGLGLAIVYRILEQHQAKINVESQCGRGTAFTLVFRKI